MDICSLTVFVTFSHWVIVIKTSEEVRMWRVHKVSVSERFWIAPWSQSLMLKNKQIPEKMLLLAHSSSPQNANEQFKPSHWQQPAEVGVALGNMSSVHEQDLWEHRPQKRETERSLETTNEPGRWLVLPGRGSRVEQAETVCNAACGRCAQLEEFVEVKQ